MTWKVILDPVSSKGALASDQRSLSFDGGRWFLLAEPTSILRLSDIKLAGDITSVGSTNLIGATPAGDASFKFPSQNNAPEFYVVGSPKISHRRVGSLLITDVADDPERVERLGLKKRHTDALGYLSRVVPVPKNAPDSERSLLIVWIGVSRSQGSAGGGAGSRSFLANYILDDEANQDTNAAVTTMIIAHEQFHQLVDLLRGSAAALAPWISESLAEYYGLKALAVSDPSEAARSLRSKFIDPGAVVTSGLLELNRAYINGDRTNYNLFYTQGATFWSLVDQAIESATAGKQSLDDYVADLLSGSVTNDGALPVSFVARMQKVVGVRMEDLLAAYVSPPSK